MKLSNEVNDRASLLASDSFYRECSTYFGNDLSANARHMIAKYAFLAPFAARLRGDFDFAKTIEEEQTKNPAVTVASLAIDGNTLLSLGIEAKKLGKILSSLLIKVIKEPSVNDRDKLCSLALAFADEL